MESGKPVTCSSCQQKILSGQAITAFGSSYHLEHFVCFKCRKQMPEGSCFKKGNDLWCPACIEEAKQKCAGCKRPLNEKALGALGKLWHLECFCCVRCKKQLKDGVFLAINEKQYCHSCAPMHNN
ncbi:death associated LIM only protein [Trichuris trichiura]|uniref:Death associated LIM only protein n=1 Tax=Trichuris trichiura TaxID=36087 RepID=A0A077Z6V1_TRITR|nr:death associated LIM only protein [Trichuris trichiura]